MKKLFIFLALICLSAVACGADEPVINEPSPIQVRVVSWDHNVGQFRLAFALLDGPEAAQDVTDVALELVPLDKIKPVWSGNAVNYEDYEIPYWSIAPTVDAPGFYGAETTITQEDGTVVHSNFIIEVEADVDSIEIGEPAPPSQNKTVKSEPDLNLLSSGLDPDPALYQQTVSEALQTGRPTVVAFTTPGFCVTAWCAPVLQSVETVAGKSADAANFIHIEVFDDFQELTYVPQMAEWGLGTQEPWVFIIDADGTVGAKFSGPLSPRELEGALRPLLGE